jgi:dihydropteroate synthase-like protein
VPEHILFLTGKLAEKSLHKILESIQPTPFSYNVLDIGINVAGLMTADLIKRRVTDTGNATRVVVPGRCRGDLQALTQHYGIPIERGPEELKDMPEFFGKKSKHRDLSKYDVKIFAEIVDAPRLDIAGILQRAARYQRDGADVIDIGCLPDTPFEHLEDAIRALKHAGFQVSADSVDPEELLRAGQAGADYLLSLKEETLWVADQVTSIPVLIPNQPGDLDSLFRAIDVLTKKQKPFVADAILDPIHFGFTQSIVRYHALRERYPGIEIMMGVGNLTELTDADTSGINAILMGIISELGIGSILTTEVSLHARRAVREADAARRIMYAAREDSSLPKDYSSALLTNHDRKPFPDTEPEIRDIAAAIKDPSFRVQVSETGIHIYNRDGFHTAEDPFALFPELNLEQDGSHAFYIGVELARAQIAWQLGKRYTQDQELDWGVATDRKQEDQSAHHAMGSTLQARKKKTGES